MLKVHVKNYELFIHFRSISSHSLSQSIFFTILISTITGHSNICYRTELSHNFKHTLNHHLKATTSASKLRDYFNFGLFLLELKKYEQVNIRVWKMDLFLTSHKKGGSIYLNGSIRLSSHQSLFYLQSERDPGHKK